jgi:hypothetical protein
VWGAQRVDDLPATELSRWLRAGVSWCLQTQVGRQRTRTAGGPERDEHLQDHRATNHAVVIIVTCEECGRGYSHTRFVGDADCHGARPIQCPNCYAYLGRTEQGLES